MALSPDKLRLAEYARLRFAITPEPNVTLDQVLDSKYWVHVAAQLKPQSVIEVVPQDGSYFAELFVHSCDKTFARVQVLRVVVLDKDLMDRASAASKTPPQKGAKKSEIPEGNKGAEHYVDWGGQQSKGRVIRLADKQVVKEGFTSLSDAREWMTKHEQDAKKVEDANQTKLADLVGS